MKYRRIPSLLSTQRENASRRVPNLAQVGLHELSRSAASTHGLQLAAARHRTHRFAGDLAAVGGQRGAVPVDRWRSRTGPSGTPALQRTSARPRHAGQTARAEPARSYRAFQSTRLRCSTAPDPICTLMKADWPSYSTPSVRTPSSISAHLFEPLDAHASGVNCNRAVAPTAAASLMRNSSIRCATVASHTSACRYSSMMSISVRCTMAG